MSVPEARWLLAPPASREELLAVMERYRVSPPLAQVLHGRALTDAHLRPERRLSPNPGLHEAATRLVGAIRGKKRIRVHGDYDADGVSASSVLVLGLRALGADVHAFIPHRLNDGYGIHPDRVQEHAEACDLLLTVDCGVTNLEEVRAMLALGLEVIVTDHHSPGPEFPDCLVVHPKLTRDYDHDVHNLTGAGVAYHLLWAVHEQLGLPEPLELAGIAAIGTIADVAPLIGENRALVQAGLEQLADPQQPGLAEMLRVKNTRRPTARDVAFVIAPRINAAGRLGEADLAVELLTTQSKRRAQELVVYLDARNEERRRIQDRMFEEALQIVDPADPAIVVTKDGWHAGIMGIVASKLLETYYKPVFIMAQGKGSVRSTPGISAVEGLRYSADLLKRFGGHPGAAGFAIYDENIPRLRDRLHAYARQFPRPVPVHRLDAALPHGAVVSSLTHEQDAFEPYGEGLSRPTWWVREAISTPKLVGKTGQTLQFRIGRVRGVKHGETNDAPGERDLAANVQRDSYQGVERVELYGLALRGPAGVQLDDETEASPLARLDPRAAVERVRGGAAAYADTDVARYLGGQVPGVRLVGDADDVRGEVVLFALPPDETLRRWLDTATVSFAWGPKTLQALAGNYGAHREGLSLDADPRVLDELGVKSPLEVRAAQVWDSVTLRELAATAYQRWLWARLYVGLDDEGWSRAVRRLLGAPAVAPLAMHFADD